MAKIEWFLSRVLFLSCCHFVIESDYMTFHEVNSTLAWKHLSEKFAGRNNAEKMKLIKQLNESRMGKKEDPDEWITNLERLK